MDTIINHKFPSETILWQALIKKSEIPNISDEQIKKLQTELTSAVGRICFDYGIHN